MRQLLHRCTRALCGLGLAALLVTPAIAAHSAVLNWAAPSDVAAGSTYNVYRASGACPTTGLGTLTFSIINTAPVSALTYTDSTVTVGTWCYYVTQIQSGTESAPSTTAGGPVRPNAVTTIQIVIN